MAERDKLVRRLCEGRAEASYSDVDRLLRTHGWRLANQKGSHVTYRKANELPIVVAKLGGRKVKRYKIDEICQRLGLDD